MNVQNQASKHSLSYRSLNYKLNPISLIVVSLFAQQAFAQSDQEQDKLSLLASKQLAGSSALEPMPLISANHRKTGNIVLADATAAIQSNKRSHPAANTADVDDVLFGDDPKHKKVNPNLPTTADRYGATKEILKTAAVSDAQAQGTGKTDSQGKPIAKSTDIELKAVTVRAKRFHEIGPLPGLGLTKEEIPGNVQSISAKEIKESHSLSLTDLLNKKLQSVNVNDYQGNPFMMDVTYRGFTAGPQIGTPQGLSVFLDGIRVNEPFGDVVNWDMIPMNAIAGVDVFPGSNPIFGLNTLGGAFTLKTKDGFTNEGVDAEILAGSYGRKQLQVEGGINNGEFALFGAGNFFLEDGWRKDSPSKVNQFFGKGSYRGEKLDLNLSTLLVQTDLVGNGLLPSEMYAQDHASVFTSPDTTKNKLMQFQLSGAFQVSDNFSITGQAYRRNSKRHSIGADAFTDYDIDLPSRRLAKAGEEYTCLFNSTGYARANGLPDFYVVPVEADASGFADLFSSQIYLDAQSMDPATFDSTYANIKNTVITNDQFLTAFKFQFNTSKNLSESFIYNRGTGPTPPTAGDPVTEFNNEPSYYAAFSGFEGGNVFAGGLATVNSDEYFFSKQVIKDGNGNIIDTKIFKNFVMVAASTNEDKCRPLHEDGVGGLPGGRAYQVWVDENDHTKGVKYVDGAIINQPGVVEGTPTAIINNNQIDQIVDGASIQFNWNLEHHKFMVGVSIDAASADYTNTSQLGFLDVNRKAYLDPSQALPQFIGAYQPINNNDFSGTNTTKSIYFSETWTPVDTWHFNASGRYNDTSTKNKIAARYGIGVFGIGDVTGVPNQYNTCNGNCSTDTNKPPVNYRLYDITKPLDAAETEKFSYYSFNPSLGATWQAKENLNLFANWAKGTRTPSVIELGCAFDDTPTPNSQGAIQPKSLAENRTCTLPTTLSGDPFLPQIKATTYDVGARGTWGSNLQWNLGAYQTDLKDDIYFVALQNGSGFFDSIGKTRRRGLEAGLSGKLDKWSFGVNYGLTDATFQDDFQMLSADNSSASVDINGLADGIIQVKKGNRMPGVPLHNLNANIGYDLTDKWTIGFSAVVHSESFVRGNENNQHQAGVVRYRRVYDPVLGDVLTPLPPTKNPGKVAGYATFNFQTSYQFNKEWSATLLVNNLFDKEYFSAGRLGRNPFSPHINGAIGPDGYNHNSYDWLSTNFIAPAAPRAAWVMVRYQFAKDRN